MTAAPSLLDSLLQKAQTTLIDALFPPRCAGCGRFSHTVFCGNCQRALQPIQPPFCLQCGDPLDPLAQTTLCRACRASRAPLILARAQWHFDGPAREAIHRFKYAGKWALGARLAPFLAKKLDEDTGLRAFAPEILVAVPLHNQRQKRRGFNQSEILVEELSKLGAGPAWPLLQRTRATQPQVGLNSKERHSNVRGAFLVGNDSHKLLLKNKRVLLVDDVFTTGATLHDCARALREGGALDVAALTLARQTHSDSRPPIQKLVGLGEFVTDL